MASYLVTSTLLIFSYTQFLVWRGSSLHHESKKDFGVFKSANCGDFRDIKEGLPKQA
jgi:hypothetical protein